jgi:hypothetical protein
MLFGKGIGGAVVVPSALPPPSRFKYARNMARHAPRSSSGPESFTVAEAARLKLRIQTLDDSLEPTTDIATLQRVCQPRPFHETIYLEGSEDFYLRVKHIPRPDLIPDVYIEAYDAVLHGRFPVNHGNISDLSKGVDPTFSQILPVLDQIDILCSTKLADAYRSLEAAGMYTRIEQQA